MNDFESDPIRAETNLDVLAAIDAETEQRVRFYATQTRGVISNRLVELENEWDVERHLQAHGAGLALTGLLLGFTASKKWLLLTGGVLALLFRHSIRGTSCPVQLLRLRGIRTRSEIEKEKFALKALRGDFESIPPRADNNDILRAHDALRAVAY